MTLRINPSHFRNQIALQSQRRELLGNYYIENDYVCTMPDGEVISPNYLTRIFHSIVEHSTLPHIRFHDLRHSATSNLLNAGFSVVQVQEWLSHSSAETTLRYYGHVDKSSKKAIADALNKLDRQKDAEKEILTDNLAKENSSVRLKVEAEENNKIGAQITRNKIAQLNPNTA